MGMAVEEAGRRVSFAEAEPEEITTFDSPGENGK